MLLMNLSLREQRLDIFNVEIKVNKDYSYEVTETIDALFNWGKHGIIRYIPISGNYKIDNISVEGDEYEVRKKRR